MIREKESASKQPERAADPIAQDRHRGRRRRRQRSAAPVTDMQVITLLFISYMVVRPSVRPFIAGEEGARVPLH